MIQRTIAKNLTTAIRSFHALSLTGPRQSGKTTLVRSLFPAFHYSNLEIPNIREFARVDPVSFLAQSPRMIIDEIQHVPDLVSYIQGLIDENPSNRYILTGSENFTVSGRISQSLSGRIHIATLLPLSLHELQKSGIELPTLPELMFSGLYPRIWDESPNPHDWYQSYIATYLERDVRQIKQIGNLVQFQTFLGLIAGRTGQILNLTSLSGDVGVSVPTVQSWLSILEASYIIMRLAPYHTNIRKRLIKSPKIHFYDTGLACALLNITSVNDLARHPLFGSLFESFIVSEYAKKISNKTESARLYYIRDKTGTEADLLVVRDHEIELVETKSAKTVTSGHLASLLKATSFLSGTTKTRLVYGGDRSYALSGTAITPWWKM